MKGKNGRIMIMKKVKIIICILLVMYTTDVQNVFAERGPGVIPVPVTMNWTSQGSGLLSQYSRVVHITVGDETVHAYQFEDLSVTANDMLVGTRTSGIASNWIYNLRLPDGRVFPHYYLFREVITTISENTPGVRVRDMSIRINLTPTNNWPPPDTWVTYHVSATYEYVNSRWVKQGDVYANSGIIGSFYFDTELSYAPIIDGNLPVPESSTTSSYTANIPTGTMQPLTHQLEQNITLSDLNENITVESGATNRTLTDTAKAVVGTPQNELYVLTDLGGQPMNNGSLITGIGKTTWLQRVTDFDGDSTEFERDVTIQTDKKPNINLVYDDGDLAGTPFTDGTANGGVDGWSNVPLRAVVHSKNDDDSYVVDGYYFNQINDDQGGIAHGDNQKEPASKVYATETAGTNVTGVMVDDAKTTELSATTEPVSMKIDMTNPVAAASYDTDTDTLINQSEDDLSGLQMTKVAIVSPGDPAPAETAYRDFSEWQSLVNGNRQYDIYIIATDKAGNTATTTLTNQFLRGGATNLEISKTVVGKYGAYHKPFEVTVALEDDQGIAVNGAYTVSSSLAGVADYTLTFVNGVGVVYIKHGETISIQGISVGYKYTVKETDEVITVGDSLYSVTYNGGASATGVTAVLDGSSAQVEIKNIRETIPDTGIEENRGTLLLGSTLILLVFLIALNRYCDKKRRYQL